MEYYNKLFTSLRYFLQGRKMYNAVTALEYASHFHNGKRKDGVTPEFQHQLEIAHYVRAFEPHLSYPEETFAAIALHDVCEDADVGFIEIESKFGKLAADAVKLMTKKHRGEKKDTKTYFSEVFSHPISSVGKGGDRIHNHQSMVGVFTREKQISYIEETETYILPGLKKARREIPQQEPVYENMKYMLKSQIALLQAIHNAEEAAKKPTFSE
jgi:(p)ppGpp synthase/HD superfamily hydrolase